MEGITYLVIYPGIPAIGMWKGKKQIEMRDLPAFKTIPGVYKPLEPNLLYIQVEEAPEGKPTWVRYKVMHFEDIISISGQVHRRIYVHPNDEFGQDPIERDTFLESV